MPPRRTGGGLSAPGDRPRIGLALGGGSARGWAHIGVIRALEEAGIRPDLVCGTSIGALVGAACVAGELDRLETWVRSLTPKTVVSFLDFTLGGGLIKGEKLIEFFRAHFVDRDMRELDRPYGAVATDLVHGREVWLREGRVSDAVRASIALPGLFTPALHDGVWLVDGGLVNPVPVSLARAMGADFVIAVDLNSGLLGRHLKKRPAAPAGKPTLADSVRARLGIERDDGPAPPAMLDVLASSINIMQVLITRSRFAGEPADALVTPPLADLGLMEFHRAALAIDVGRHAAREALPTILARLAEDRNGRD